MISKLSLKTTENGYTLDSEWILWMALNPTSPLIWCLLGRRKDKVKYCHAAEWQKSSFIRGLQRCHFNHGEWMGWRWMALWTKGRSNGWVNPASRLISRDSPEAHFWRQGKKEDKMSTKPVGLHSEKASSHHTPRQVAEGLLTSFQSPTPGLRGLSTSQVHT